MWILSLGVLFSVGCFEAAGVSLPHGPVCVSSDYIERRRLAETTLLREISALSVLGSDSYNDSDTLEGVYRSILAATNTTDSPKSSASFYEALAEISRAYYRACYGSAPVAPGDFPALASAYENAFESKDVRKIREVFGYLLCLKVRTPSVSASRTRRTTYTNINEFFDCIDGTDLGVIFFGLSSADFSVAFVIDDTGSMGEEIDAVKCLVRSFVKSERDGPAKYILGTFNDPGEDMILILSDLEGYRVTVLYIQITQCHV